MLVANWVNKKTEVSSTRTYEDFYKLLGDQPAMLGVMSRMYKNNTITFLTEALGNTFEVGGKKQNKYQPINSMCIQWDIDIDYIKYVEFSAPPIGNGAMGASILMYFKERYYELYDTFKINDSKQSCIVLDSPIQKSPGTWEYTVQLLDADYSEILDITACQTGCLTRWISNIQPEISEIGYTKYTSNFETHRAWITEHRCDIDFSSRYAMMEDKFLSIANRNETSGAKTKEAIFKVLPVQKQLFENFQEAKNQHQIWGKTTMDKNGKSTVSTRDGRPLIAGDGIIPQVERFCNKEMYYTMSVDVLNHMMKSMSERAKNLTGNHYMYICNQIQWLDIQTTLQNWLKAWNSTPTVVYSTKENSYVKIGATYMTYENAGNTISFTVDKALSIEYSDRGYGICLDTTPDISENQPAIQAFTLKGHQFVTSTLKGHGGISGTESGVVSTPVEASKLIVTGYEGVALFSPYRAFIAEQYKA